MTFRDLLKLYKAGELHEDKKTSVENEIEKFEALSDYIFSDIAIDEPAKNAGSTDDYEALSAASDKEKDFSRIIRAQIRKAFIKMGIVILTIILTAVLFTQFALSPIIDNLYYDPTELVTIDATSDNTDEDKYPDITQFESDFKVFSELRMPLEARNYASAIPLGYGEYRIDIGQNVFFDYENIKPSVGGTIKRGKIDFYDQDFQNHTVHNLTFTYNTNVSFSESLEDGTTVNIPSDENYKEERQLFLDTIKDYDKDKMLKTQISFKSPINFDEFIKIIEKYDLDQTWAAVEFKDREGEIISNSLGLSFNTSGTLYVFDKDKYPYLNMIEYSDDIGNEDIMKQHFLSMLSYIKDQKKFQKMMEQSVGLEDNQPSIYEYAYDYVKKNGLSMIGCAAYISKENIEKIIDDGVAYNIQFMQLEQQ